MNSVEEIELGPLRIAGLPARVRNSEPEAIGAHWARFNRDETVGSLTNKLSRNVVAVYTEYESDYTGAYTLLLGYKVPQDARVPGGLRVVDIPRQKYGVLLSEGDQPAALRETWQWVWASRLDRAYTSDFDEFLTPTDVRVHVALR